jgi:hypothetical protein
MISRPTGRRRARRFGPLLAAFLVVPRGQMKTNLLGMSFLDRLESWGVQADRLMLHGYPDVSGASGRHRRVRAGIN